MTTREEAELTARYDLFKAVVIGITFVVMTTIICMTILRCIHWMKENGKMTMCEMCIWYDECDRAEKDDDCDEFESSEERALNEGEW